MSQEFYIGWLVGIFSAIPIGYVFRGILVSWIRATSPSRKQKVIHSTDRSPFQVLMDAILGFFLFLFWASVLLLFLYFGGQWLIDGLG